MGYRKHGPTFQNEDFSVFIVFVAVSARALYTTQCFSTVVLSVCSKWQPSASWQAFHYTKHCLLLAHYPDNAPVLTLKNPRNSN